MDPIAGTLRPLGQTDRVAAAARLECGDLLTFTSCPFMLPDGDERAFLCGQRLDGAEPKHIGYDPQSCRIYGCALRAAAEAERLQRVLALTGENVTRWLQGFVPSYAGGMDLEYVAFHPEEEATRKLGTLERNDLLHIDVPSDRSHGRRLLRLYVNLHPTDARVWQTSLSFAELLDRYGHEIGLPCPDAGWWQPLRQGLQRLLQGGRTTAPFPEFMQRLHDFLKQHDAFQERAPKKCWQLRPETAWLVFTDGVAHAELRGRFVLEFAFLIAQHQLARPELSPSAQFERACGILRKSQAA